MTSPIRSPLEGVASSSTAAHQLAAPGEPDRLLASATQLGVPNMELLAQQIAPIARQDPARAGELLGAIAPRLSNTDRQRLANELGAQLPGESSSTGRSAPGPEPDAQELASRKRELALDLTQIGLSLAGIVDPTPISDGLDGVISLFRGDWLGAGISAVSMIPYIGDAAKLGKLGTFARTVERAVDLARLDPAYARTIAPALEKIGAALDAVPLDALPGPARQAVESMKGKIDELAQAGAKTVAVKIGRNDVSWNVDADGRAVSAHADLRELFDGTRRTSAEQRAQRARADEGLPDDVGGHIIGHRFIKAHGEKNIFPQNTQFNNSAYRTMENEWADWIRSGKEVSVDVRLIGDGVRPDTVEVFYRVIDPLSGKTIFKNSADFANGAGQVFDRVPRADMQ